jgi:hypothetical protein
VIQGHSSSSKPVYDKTNPFSEKIKPYFRAETRMAFRKNGPKSSWLLALDIQNVTNRENKRPFSWGYALNSKLW